MSILTNDNTLAWTLSDNTSGSNKSKRGGAGKPKAAPSSQDVLTGHIAKYLSSSAKVENDNFARQLALQEKQHELDERRVALQEEQMKMDKMKLERQYHGGHGYGSSYGGNGYGISYGGPRPRSDQDYHRYDHPQQHYNVVGQGHRHGIAYDRGTWDSDMSYEQRSSRFVHDMFNDRREKDEAMEKYHRQMKELDQWKARDGTYYEVCDVLELSHSGQGSSSKFKSPKVDDSFESSHQPDATHLTQDRGGYVISCLNIYRA